MTRKEKLYTVEFTLPSQKNHIILCKDIDNNVEIGYTMFARWRGIESNKLTESEINQNFAWAWELAEEVSK